MNFVTKSVTTMFLASYRLQYRGVKTVFSPLYIVEGDIYRAYCHQNTFKSFISLLKKPVFIVVTELVTLFGGGRGCEETAVTTWDAQRIKPIYWDLARPP